MYLLHLLSVPFTLTKSPYLLSVLYTLTPFKVVNNRAHIVNNFMLKSLTLLFLRL